VPLFTRSRQALLALLVVPCALAAPLLTGCPGEPTTAASMKPRQPLTEIAKKWLKRAGESYRAGDLADADDSVKKGLEIAKKENLDERELRLIAGRIDLAKLDFKQAAIDLADVPGSEAAGLRARAFWYEGDLAHTTEELTKALEDPEYKDPWAKPVRDLAGSQGAGRKPFTIADGGVRSLVEMKMPRDLYPALMVQCEIDGQSVLALIDTGVPEVVLDKATHTNPAWVSIKFGTEERSLEVRDVPTMVDDLSGYTQQNQVPIRAILGVNFIRRMHMTFDRRADQLVFRRADPPAPPVFSRADVLYVRGGGMTVRSTARKEFELTSSMWLDSGAVWPIAYVDETWKKLGVDVAKMPVSGDVKYERLIDFRVAALDLGPAVGVSGAPQLEEKLKQIDIDVAGGLGMGFLAGLRVTVAEQGRALWLETDEGTSNVLNPQNLPAAKPAATATPEPTTTSSAAPKPTTSAAPTATTTPAPKPPATTTPAPKPTATTAPKPAATTATPAPKGK
jgi:hypothetical protein